MSSILTDYERSVFSLRADSSKSENRRRHARAAEKVTRKLFFLLLQSVSQTMLVVGDGILCGLFSECAQYLHVMNPSVVDSSSSRSSIVLAYD